MKTSTVTPSFYYVFNISLYCNDTIPSFIGNLWQVLLPGNHLNDAPRETVSFVSPWPQYSLRWSRETKLTVSRGASHKVFCYTFQLKNRKRLRKKLFAWRWLAHKFAAVWRTTWLWPDYMWGRGMGGTGHSFLLSFLPSVLPLIPVNFFYVCWPVYQAVPKSKKIYSPSDLFLWQCFFFVDHWLLNQFNAVQWK